MSTSRGGGYSFPGAHGDPGRVTPASPSSLGTRPPQVICPGPGTSFPPLDSRLVTPETREEMVGGVRMETMASEPPHGDTQFDFSRVLGAVLQPGYVGSIDMLTRYSEGDDFAADLSVRQGGTNPDTGQRYLEELVFEIGNTQRLSDLRGKAANMSQRGVRRIFAIMVQDQTAHEWDPAAEKMRPMKEDAISDPRTLVRPLPLSLVLLIARGAMGGVAVQKVQAVVNDFVAEALDAQGNPAIRLIEQRGEERGERRAMVQAILTTMAARSVTVDDVSRRRILACADPDTLLRWMIRAVTASCVEDLFT